MKTVSILKNLIIAAMITVCCLLVYASVQQVYRTSANDPQIQMGRDVTNDLKHARSIDHYFSDTVDLSESLSPFIVLYDINGKPLRSSGLLHGQMLPIPGGVFKDIDLDHKEITTMPERKVRLAMSITKTGVQPIAYVATGRSLNEIEFREASLLQTVFFVWIILESMFIIYIMISLLKNKTDQKNNYREERRTVA